MTRLRAVVHWIGITGQPYIDVTSWDEWWELNRDWPRDEWVPLGANASRTERWAAEPDRVDRDAVLAEESVGLVEAMIVPAGQTGRRLRWTLPPRSTAWMSPNP